MSGTKISFSDGKITIGSTSIQKSSRDAKGKSLLSSLRDFTAIDVETTGLSSTYDAIIELAAVRYRDGKKMAEYSQLVYPGFEIDEFISELTGITNEMLSNMPKIAEALPDFLRFVGKDTVVGHNVNFDINFIYDNCVDCGFELFSNDFIDTMRIAKRLYKGWDGYRLDNLIDSFNLEKRCEHRACNDAELTAKAYLIMCSDERFQDAMNLSKKQKAADVLAVDGLLQEDNPLFGKVCVFTGVLETMARQDAMQIVVNIGGICEDRVTKRTNYLILGNNDYCKTIKDGKSIKQKKAEQLILNGADLQIIPESDFIDIVVGNSFNEKEKAMNHNHGEELAAFISIKPDLLKVIEENWIDPAKLSFESKATYSSIKYGMNVVVRISARNTPYISLPSFEEHEQRYKKIPLCDLGTITDYKVDICQSLQRIVDTYTTDFSCCSRYQECSDAFACTNPDKTVATGCSYRKKLKKGIVFYGKNRNIE